ncbi:hypothetical protein G9A89_008402 [Geosiphon pyriformis]|nr:hypothetical protein G9A89_008402 [Geosiphon pyriformis]
MDNLNNLTIWDVKDVFNKVKNVVMNYTEMEAKVREATNNEAWGASSTLMQEIAQGTYNYQYFNEIMPTIYKRFTEKEARQWRQIYKALVLLEYLVKHGSERVVDDARAHMATIKIMRNFAYIDEKSKDQGINVRNRAKELAELLSDVEKIRTERKKAKANRTKYTSVSSDSLGYGGSFGGSSSRYGGFNTSESFGYSEERSRTRYDDYEAQWASEARTSPTSPTSPTGDTRSGGSRSSLSINKKTNEMMNIESPTTPNPENGEVSLFDFDVPSVKATNRNSIGIEFSQMKSNNSIDDDFQDFQSAPPLVPPHNGSTKLQQPNLNLRLNTSHVTSISAVPQPVPSRNNLIDDLLGSVSPHGSSNATLNLIQPKSLTTGPLSANSLQKLSNLNVITQTPNQQNSANQFLGFNNTSQKSNDPWIEASNLVSLDSLGVGKDTTSKQWQSVAPSMNSLAQANNNSSSWASKGIWTSNIQQKPQIPSQKSQDPFDLLL